MPGPKGGYPGGPPVGTGLQRSPWPGGEHIATPVGRFGPVGHGMPSQPYGQRVPGGVQLQMHLAESAADVLPSGRVTNRGRGMGKPRVIAMNGPVLSGFYKVFPGKSIKDAPQLLAKGATGMAHLIAKFGDDAVRLALKLPK